jgi:hypothetical protein
MKKQTIKAVEWLEEQLKKGVDFNPLDPLSYQKAVDKLFEEAKAMEKLNIYMAYLQGHRKDFNSKDEALLLMYEYYDETFGQ